MDDSIGTSDDGQYGLMKGLDDDVVFAKWVEGEEVRILGESGSTSGSKGKNKK